MWVNFSSKPMISLFVFVVILLCFEDYLKLKHCLYIAAVTVLELSECFIIHFLASRLVVGMETTAEVSDKSFYQLLSHTVTMGWQSVAVGTPKGSQQHVPAPSIAPTPTAEPADGKGTLGQGIFLSAAMSWSA